MDARAPQEAAREGLDRSLVAVAYLAVLLLFFVTQRVFAGLSQVPSPVVVALIIASILLRVMEFVYWRRFSGVPARETDRRFATASIAWSLALVLPLAIASHESDSPYFGMLMLPVLEAAIYFPMSATIAVATLSSSLSIFWVLLGAHFHPPFSVGEMLESATLVLMFYIVGMLAWFLTNRVRRREQQLREHIAELEVTRNRLVIEEKLSAVGRLASSIAHEIRNPVAIISSALEASNSDAFAQSERDEMSRVAMVEARRLENLTSDFLSYANLSAAPFERVDLATLVGYVEGIVRVQALDKGLHVELDLSDGFNFSVHGNEGQLQQVLLNLMRNAVEAAPEKSTVRIRVRSTLPTTATIAIENAGPAIPAGVINRIFEPFFTNKPGGTGLGLATAKRIVEAHHGTLDVECNQDGSVIFAVTLPAFAETEVEPQSAVR